MTREEAIYRLKALLTMCDFRDAYGNTVSHTVYDEAVDMAIEALKAQLPECKVMPVSCDKKDCELCKNEFCTADILILNSDGVCEL